MKDLRREFGLAEGEMPRFSLVLLGWGTTAHRVALPAYRLLREREKLVGVPFVESWRPTHYSHTARASSAREVLFLWRCEQAPALARCLKVRRILRVPKQLLRQAKGGDLDGGCSGCFQTESRSDGLG